MNIIYRDGEIEILNKELENSEEKHEVEKMINSVGDFSIQEAYDLLDEINKAIEPIMRNKCGTLTSGSKDEVCWQREIWMFPHEKRKLRLWQYGYTINEDSNSIDCWFWSKNGEKGEKAFIEIFKNTFQNLKPAMEFDEAYVFGSVFIERVNLIQFEENKNTIDLHKICNNVTAIFSKISKENLDTLFEIG